MINDHSNHETDEIKITAKKLDRNINWYMFSIILFILLPLLLILGLLGLNTMKEIIYMKHLVSMITIFQLDKLFKILFYLSLIPVFLLKSKLVGMGYEQEWGKLLRLSEEEIRSKAKLYQFAAGFMLVLIMRSIA